MIKPYARGFQRAGLDRHGALPVANAPSKDPKAAFGPPLVARAASFPTVAAGPAVAVGDGLTTYATAGDLPGGKPRTLSFYSLLWGVSQKSCKGPALAPSLILSYRSLPGPEVGAPAGWAGLVGTDKGASEAALATIIVWNLSEASRRADATLSASK